MLHPTENRSGGATKLNRGGCLGQWSVCQVIVTAFHRIKVISVLQNDLVYSRDFDLALGKKQRPAKMTDLGVSEHESESSRGNWAALWHGSACASAVLAEQNSHSTDVITYLLLLTHGSSFLPWC